jgi:hypothetical protein
MHSVCIGDRLKVASTHVVAVFRKSDGLVVHVHNTTVFEGARGVSKQEAMDEAVREAKCHGHDVQELDLLVVEEEFPRETGILRVDKDRRRLLVEAPTTPINSDSRGD